MRKLERDKSASLADASQLGDIAKMKLSDYESQPLSWRDILNIIISFGGFAFLMYGVAAWKWSTKDYGPLFLAMGVASGIVGRLSVDTISNSIVKGFEKIVFAAMILGVAAGISGILKAGNIIDTIVYALSAPLAKVGPVVGANLMFVVNGIIDVFIPSNAGQAAAVMPLMVPIADILGVTRQVAVQAYQFGSGYVDPMIPTSFSLFICLGMSGVSYKNYLKFMFPIFISWCVLSIVSLTILQMIGWGPF